MKPLINKLSRLNKVPPAAYWAVLTAFVCFFIISVSVPGALAQTAEGKRDGASYKSIIQTVFDFIQDNYVEEIDQQTLYEGAMNGMFESLGDPYSGFLKEKDMTALDQNVIKGNYGGVGLYISKQTRTGGDDRPAYVEIASPIEDGPGWKAGLQPADLIVKIEEESTDVLTLDEAVERLKGPEGQKVNITIRRGAKLEFPVTLTRAIVEVPTVKSAMIGDIGYLRLISFSNMTFDRAREALKAFAGQDYKALVLDLRNNYGGLLNAAVSVSNLFIKEGVVVSVKSRISTQNSRYTAGSNPAVPQDIPVVVLINHGSASASEIVAGALKDHGRAYLVGEKSFGKGSVQQVYPLQKSGFKITTARYYTPSDVNIDKVGIPPDREVLFPEFSEEEAEKLNELLVSGAIPDFVESSPDAAPEAVDGFARKLRDEYGLDLALIRRLIRDERNRTVIAPVYDMEYDVQLQEAVRIIRDGAYHQLIQNTKTLRALQEESLDDDAQAS